MIPIHHFLDKGDIPIKHLINADVYPFSFLFDSIVIRSVGLISLDIHAVLRLRIRT